MRAFAAGILGLADSSLCVGAGELLFHSRADGLDQLVPVEEADLLFGGVQVHVDVLPRQPQVLRDKRCHVTKGNVCGCIQFSSTPEHTSHGCRLTPSRHLKACRCALK